MKVLQFKNQTAFDEWLKDHELFECYDNEYNHLGEILGTDADTLVFFDLARINVPRGFVHITKELTEQQMEHLKENTLVKTVIVEDIFYMTAEQRVVIRRLKKDFEDAKEVGLFAMSNDESNMLYFLNGKSLDRLVSDDDLGGEWKEVDGKREFVKYTEAELSKYVEIDTELYCECIRGNNSIDFISWGSGALPWHGQLKL